MLLWASAAELQEIDQVSDIQWRVDALEETQKECIQLLTEELEESRSGVALLTLFSSSVPKPPPLTQKITKPSCPAWGGYN